MSTASLGILRKSGGKHNREDVNSRSAGAGKRADVCMRLRLSLNSIHMRWLKRIAAGLVIMYLAIAAVVWVVVSLPPARFAAIMSKLPTSENPGPLFLVIPIGPLMMLAR